MTDRSRQIALPALTAFLAAFLIAGCDAAPVAPEAPPQAQLGAADHSTGAPFAGAALHSAADVFGQGPGGPVVAEDAAEIRRTPNGISVKVSMPTPEPGSYMYPDGAEVGHPEAFTL